MLQNNDQVLKILYSSAIRLLEIKTLEFILQCKLSDKVRVQFNFYNKFCKFNKKFILNFLWNHCFYSLFRLTSLIYAEKFEFENPVIIEDKQCKQTELFSVMTKERD